MHISTRISTAVHLLVFLAWDKERRQSSEKLADSVNTNAVVVRRLVGLLRKAGIVESFAGVHGGVRLARDPAHISLRDVYRAVEGGSLFRMHDPSEDCPLGCVIAEPLQVIYDDAEEAMGSVLADKSIADLAEQALALTTA